MLQTTVQRKPMVFTVPVRGDEACFVMDNTAPILFDSYHLHRELQISYIVCGSCAFILGNLIRPCLEDQIVLIKPNDPHLFFKDERITTPSEIHVIHLFLSLEKLRPFFDMAEMQAIKSLFYSLDASKLLPAKFAAPLKELFLPLATDGGPSKLIKLLKLFKALVEQQDQFISMYSGLSKVNFPDADGLRINTVIKYTLENYKRNIAIEEIAAVVHLTPTAFCKFFKKHTQKT